MRAGDSSRVSVLLIEDHRSFASTLTAVLETDARDHPADGNQFLRVESIEHVRSLEEANGRLSNESFDVILLDLDLPDSAGLETVERVTATAPLTPIIVLTGRYDHEMGIAAIEYGAQDFLRKDQIEPTLLRRTVRFALVRSQTQQELANYVQQLSFLDDVLRRGVRNELGTIIGREPELRGLAQHHPALEGVLQSAHAILRMIDAAGSSSRTLLDDELETSVRSIESILTDAVDTVAEDHRFDYKLECPDDRDPAVECPPILAMAITEVLRNAVIHCYTTEPDVHIDVIAGDAVVTVAVIDNGVGMSQRRCRLLSDAEGRFDPRAGMGVGLFLVTTAMDNIGGTFNVEPNDRGGTTVCLTIPRADG